MTAPGKLLIGDWLVDPAGGRMSRAGQSVRVEARTLRVLLELADRAGEVVGIEELLERVWPDVIVTPDSVYQAVASLRRLLGDDARQPRYIATAARLGYRMVAVVTPWTEVPGPGRPQARPGRRARVTAGFLAIAVLIAAGLAYAWIAHAPRAAFGAGRQGVSVGVAPFVDLTPTMDQDQLADEMTEGLADRLGANAALKTPGFRSSFYLIGKPMTVAQAARRLGVSYVVDGGVRRSGERVRISARLVRGSDGLVLWSRAYDCASRQMGPVQVAVAGAVANRLGIAVH